jgi:dTDP-4-dehydrorhamnose reductase
MRVLVLGSNGMVGRHVAEHLDAMPGVEVRRATRLGGGGTIACDAALLPDISGLLHDIDVVVNAMGVLRSHPAYPGNSYVQLATKVNAIWPIQVALAAGENDVRMIHVSTDAVFGPSSLSADENEPVGPTEPYGLSKALGEPHGEHVITIRCSVVGPSPERGIGLWEWFVRQPRGSTVQGYSSSPWSGVTAGQFATLVGDLVAGDVFLRVRREGLCHHFVPNGSLTKFEFLELMRDAFRPDISVVPVSELAGIRALTTCREAWLDVYTGPRSWQDAIDAAASYPRLHGE